MQPEPPIKTAGSKVVYQNRWITIHEDITQLPSGGQGMYGYMESKDSVMVVVFDADYHVLLLHAFRYPSKSWGWELPGGSSDGEDLLQASKRELEEETGILADTWELAGKTYVCNGLMTERMATCIAYDIHHTGVKEVSDETFLGSKFYSFDEIDAMIERGEINDGQTITGLYFAKQWLAKKEAA